MYIEWWHALIAVSMLVGIGIWIGKVETNQKNFRQFMEEIRNDIKQIFMRLPTKPLSETSPLSLTDKGRKMLAEIDGKDWARELAAKHVNEVRDMDEYQVQEFCFNFVKDLELTEEQGAKIRKCAYENASTKEETLDVLAVEVRDLLLEKIGKAPKPN